jgi:hypothetical protein
MDAGLDLVIQQPVQHLVPLHETLACELLRHDGDPAARRGAARRGPAWRA